jgi:hypothetical protein
MSRQALRAAALALVLVLPTPAVLASIDAGTPPPGNTSTEVLLDRILLASGVGADPERADLVERFASVVERLERRFGGDKLGYRKARRVYRELHQRYLREYDESADALELILEDGRYNCLSASLFSAVVYEALGYPTRIVEMPGHLFLEIDVRGRRIDIESTSAHGFDVARRLRAYESGIQKPNDDMRWLGVSARVRSGSSDLWHVSLDEAVGFAWLNRAWRAWHEKDAVSTADHVLEAGRFLPGMAARASGVDRLLGEAFRWEYERGGFDAAYRVAIAGFELDGSSTSSRDRLLAVAVKRVANLCDADDPAAAVHVLDEVRELGLSGPDRQRLERGASPVIAVAAVRIEDFDLAREAARRYAEVEPDTFESERLSRWVEFRSGRSGTPGPLACEPLAGTTLLTPPR